MSKKKYRKGKQIRSVSEFEQSDSVWFIVKYGNNEKTTHRGRIESWQYRMLQVITCTGRLYEAEYIEEKVYDNFAGKYIDKSEMSLYAPPERYTIVERSDK